MTDLIDEGYQVVAGNKISGEKEQSRPAGAACGESAKSGELVNSLDADSESGRVVSARGTEDGLVLRIDGRAAWQEILGELEGFLGGRKKFFEGGEVSVEWLERLPTKEQSSELEQVLRDHYGMKIITRKKRPFQTVAGKRPVAADADADGKNCGVTIKLFNEFSDDIDKRTALVDQVEKFTADTLGPDLYSSTLGSAGGLGSGMGGWDKQTDSAFDGQRYGNRVASLLGDEFLYEDDANAKIHYGTLRSGQKVETPFSLIVIGDVNPGADLTAGGDIIVLGSLRGTAHAAAYDDDAFDRVIVALQMQPMQLRIGSVISRGSDEVVRGAEIARIENRRIIVEQYNPRALQGKRLK